MRCAASRKATQKTVRLSENAEGGLGGGKGSRTTRPRKSDSSLCVFQNSDWKGGPLKGDAKKEPKKLQTKKKLLK